MEKQLLIIGFVLLMSSVKVYSQHEDAEVNVYFTLPEVALVDIEPGTNNSIHFSLNAPVESGEPPFVQYPSNEQLWINYSSSLGARQNSRSIVAEISQGTAPDGIRFFLEASSYSGSGGAGQMGQAAGRVELSSQPREVITNIGNCFTGNGINNGHLLSFSIEVSDYSEVSSVDESNLIVLYTITDN